MNENSSFAPSCPVQAQSGDAIELGHGGGGLLTRRLIDRLFRPAFAESADELTHDGVVVEMAGACLAFTTDTYVVRPLFFPGGDIGSLAVNGTVNDLAMCGAEPLYLSVAFVIEEGFAVDDLRRVVESMARAARAVGARLVTGDTKVVERGKGDGVYVNTSGIGLVTARTPISPQQVRPGDAVVLSGDVGRHGIAVMAAREALGFETPVTSDCAPLTAPVRELIASGIELHCLRDLTRGGLATALIEIAEAGAAMIRLEESAIPVSDPVRGACEVLGLDPFYVANEGRFVAVVPAHAAAQTLGVLRAFDASAAIIGHVAGPANPGAVCLDTLGGARTLDLLVGDQLPRIC